MNYEGFCEVKCDVFWKKQIHNYKKILNNISSLKKAF